MLSALLNKTFAWCFQVHVRGGPGVHTDGEDGAGQDGSTGGIHQRRRDLHPRSHSSVINVGSSPQVTQLCNKCRIFTPGHTAL